MGACATPDRARTVQRNREGAYVRVAGFDAAFTRNSFALAIGHDERPNLVTISHVWEWRPEPGAPLKPSVVFGEVAQILRAWGCASAMGDAHYKESAREAFDPMGIALLSAPAHPADAFLETRRLGLEEALALCDNPVLASQFKRVRASDGREGTIKIAQEITRDGRHGDLVSAAVLVPWQLRHVRGTGRAFAGRVGRVAYGR